MNSPHFRELTMATAVLATAVILAFAPDAYLPMLARAFILPAIVAFAAVALLAARQRRWWVAQSALVGAAMMALQVPVCADPPPLGAGHDLRLLHMNVFWPNSAFDGVIRKALESNADVISVQEVGPQWGCALADGLRARYPYAHMLPRTDAFGIAVFSRVPFLSARTMDVCGTPVIEAVLDLPDRPVRLFAMHTTSPNSYGHFRARNAQLDRLAQHVVSSGMTTVLIGDLNTVTWDEAFSRFSTRSGLAATTPALHRTWPSAGPLAIIPLDHVLVSKDVAPEAIGTIHLPGSDHRGVIADLRILPDAH